LKEFDDLGTHNLLLLMHSIDLARTQYRI
jgi:hypothetical protein